MKFSLKFLLLWIVPYTSLIAAVASAGWTISALALTSVGLNALLIAWSRRKRQEYLANRRMG